MLWGPLLKVTLFVGAKIFSIVKSFHIFLIGVTPLIMTSSEKEMFRYFGFKTKDLENVDDTDDEDCNIELGKNEK